MKKLLLILFFLVFANTLKTFADCPSWATNSNIYIFTVNGCKYAATVCWKCPINIGEAWITIDYPVPINPNCIPNPYINLAGVKRAILDQLSDPAWLYQLCSGYPFPECPSNTYTYKIKDYNCTYMYRDFNNNITYHTCNFDGWCEQTWYICWDINGPHKYLVSNWSHQGDNSCPTVMPGVPQNPGEMSTCWQWILCP
jgi:hypothetical protein